MVSLRSAGCGARYGKADGYRISFAVCAAIMLAGILLAAVKLPARPARGATVPSFDPP